MDAALQGTHLVGIKALRQQHAGNDMDHIALKLDVRLQDLGIRLLALALEQHLVIPVVQKASCAVSQTAHAFCLVLSYEHASYCL